MIGVVGEALVDLIPTSGGDLRPVLGGSPYNVARALARLDVPVSYLSPFSRDASGARLRAGLLADGVRATGHRSDHPTSLALVHLDEAGHASYSLYREGVADRDVTTDQLVALLPADATWLHSGSLALVPEDLPKIEVLFERAKARGVRTAVDVNARPLAIADLKAWRSGLARLFPLCDLIKMSVEDQDVLFPGESGLLTLRRSEPEALIVVTDGEAGARAYGHWGIIEVPAQPIARVQDTIGAGDCFQAALLAGLREIGPSGSLGGMSRGDVTRVLTWAAASAAINVGRVGCDPPRRADLPTL